MRARVVLTATVCGLLAATGVAAQAAPKKAAPACNLVVDAKGDATQFYVLGDGSVPNEPAADILSADIATNGKQMTTVLRIDKLAKSSSASPLGFVWYVYFDVDGITFFTQTKADPTGDTYSLGYLDPTGIRSAVADPAATGVIDTDKNEVRVTFNLSQLEPQAKLKTGGKITGIRGLTNRSAIRIVLQSDEAIGAKSYVEGTPSCVTVGK